MAVQDQCHFSCRCIGPSIPQSQHRSPGCLAASSRHQICTVCRSMWHTSVRQCSPASMVILLSEEHYSSLSRLIPNSRRYWPLLRLFSSGIPFLCSLCNLLFYLLCRSSLLLLPLKLRPYRLLAYYFVKLWSLLHFCPPFPSDLCIHTHTNSVQWLFSRYMWICHLPPLIFSLHWCYPEHPHGTGQINSLYVDWRNQLGLIWASWCLSINHEPYLCSAVYHEWINSALLGLLVSTIICLSTQQQCFYIQYVGSSLYCWHMLRPATCTSCLSVCQMCFLALVFSCTSFLHQMECGPRHLDARDQNCEVCLVVCIFGRRHLSWLLSAMLCLLYKFAWTCIKLCKCLGQVSATRFLSVLMCPS